MQEAELLLLGTVHADLWGFARLEAVLEVVRPDVIAVETNEQRAALYEGRFDYDVAAIYRDAQAKYERLLEVFLSNRDLFRKRRRPFVAVGLDWSERRLAAIEAGAALLTACYGFELKVAAKYVERTPGTALRLIDLAEENVDAIRQSKGAHAAWPSPSVLRLYRDQQHMLDHGLAGYVAVLSELQQAYYTDAGTTLRRSYERNVAGWAALPPEDFYRRAMFDPRREPHMAGQLRGLRAEMAGGRIVAIVGATHRYGLAALLADCPHESMSLSEVELGKAA